MSRRDGRPTSSPRRPDYDDQRDRDDRRQVDAVMVRVEQRVGVRAHPVEGDVAEIEQPAPADDDVEPEREQHVEDRVERHPAHIAAVEADGKQRDERDEEGEPGPPGHAASRSSSAPSRPPRRKRLSPWRATHSSRPTAGLVPPSTSTPQRALERPVGRRRAAHVTPSGCLRAEDPVRAEEQEQDEDRRTRAGRTSASRCSPACTPRRTEHEAAAIAPGNRADATDHGGREPLQADDEPDRG